MIVSGGEFDCKHFSAGVNNVGAADLVVASSATGGGYYWLSGVILGTGNGIATFNISGGTLFPHGDLSVAGTGNHRRQLEGHREHVERGNSPGRLECIGISASTAPAGTTSPAVC